MTVTIGKTQIHLGWPTAGSIILFLVVTTWEASMFFSSFMNSQYEMQKQLAVISKRDSIYYSKVDDQAQQIASIKQHQYHQDSLLAINKSKSVSLYTEKVINGHVVLKEITK